MVLRAGVWMWLSMLALAMVMVAVQGRKLDWGVACARDNDCALNKHNVYCRTVSASQLRCVQCKDSDDCEKEEFCVQAIDLDIQGESFLRGQCAPKKDPLYNRCSASVTSANVALGTNDQLFCGAVSSWNPDNSAATIEWEGSCIDKTCYECAVGTVSPNGNRKCYTLEASGRGGFWGTWRAGAAESSIMGVNQNALAQILIVVAFFSACTFVALAAAIYLGYRGSVALKTD
ncbi:uncharacterized protein AMSG_10554 [Thecamonas trahens ATCC 50062]|uniref:Uncharacterized protein n=1 Tax=Thecamonas trahens ATCC 50062 TaxID=461836 RepID=A0A0L0DTU4_THETB|nr:hypothetical protein AMSG_10554 [Thecamonas trahens ATCC 50062]KNC54898.1 hypothetical protein AMSG_10554 [Thecamonas trahens ATCC 50062]|eukprot:XP_013753489.1 hypothetical protein AMSG_10554 [Thecamonas trahens ATCC 50062]